MMVAGQKCKRLTNNQVIQIANIIFAFLLQFCFLLLFRWGDIISIVVAAIAFSHQANYVEILPSFESLLSTSWCRYI